MSQSGNYSSVAKTCLKNDRLCLKIYTMLIMLYLGATGDQPPENAPLAACVLFSLNKWACPRGLDLRERVGVRGEPF